MTNKIHRVFRTVSTNTCSILRASLAAVAIPLTHAMSAIPSETPALKPLAVTDDATGAALRQALIWTGAEPTPDRSFTAFRKRFTLPAPVRAARLAIFADVRYLLWINGQYVSRGPARFVPKGPEYDVIDITQYLHAGENVIATVVMARASNGKMMLHVPGLAERIEAQTGKPAPTVVQTDATWKWSRQTRYGVPLVNWGNVLDRIDATREDGDWTQPGYDDSKWSGATSIAGTSWGPLTERRIPLLREMPVEPLFAGGVRLPITLTAGQKLGFHLDRMIQAYTSIEMDAAAGSPAESRLCRDYLYSSWRSAELHQQRYSWDLCRRNHCCFRDRHVALSKARRASISIRLRGVLP